MIDWAIPESDTYFKKILAATPEGFELNHLLAALEHCQKFRTAIDSGAHIGTWTVALCKKFKKVFAFEPAADTFDCLIQNTSGLPNLVALRAALGARSGTCFVRDDLTRPGNTGSRLIQVSDKGPVQLLIVDEFGLDDLDLLKLDLEGHEAEALKGAEQTIFRCKPVIMVECKQFNPPRNGGVEATRQVLASFGYVEVGGVRNDRVYLPV